jgi:predicted phage terminase large subunit-like protein
VTLPAEAIALAKASPAGLAYVHSGGFAPAEEKAASMVWQPAPHLLLIADRLCDVVRRIRETQTLIVAGELPPDAQGPRVAIEMPPRHGKSELISRYTPPWFLGTNPDLRVMLASYGAALAHEWGRKCRDIVEELGEPLYGVRLNRDSAAADRWDLAGRRGGMVTAGIGGALTGKGGHLIIVDDPVKDQEEANSEVYRQRAKDWWASTLRTRLMPGGGIVVLQTRWHEDDLLGWLLEQARTGDGEQWDELKLPAIATEDGDALGRRVGEALWPQMYPLGALRSTEKALGSYWFAALYQQQPMPAGGGVFKRADFRYFREDALHYLLARDGGEEVVGKDHVYRFMTVDPALSEKETADFTVLAHWGVTPTMDLLLLDVERVRFEQPDVKGLVKNTRRAWGVHDVRVEAVAHGTALLQDLVRDGEPVMALEADRDKVTRALGAVPRYEAHAVFHREGAPWLVDFERELLSFPGGANDDQVDAFSYAALALPGLLVLSRRQQAPGKTSTGGLRSKML